MKYLFVGAHPDDIEWGCAGTIARLLAGQENEVKCIIMTKGENGGNAQQRVAEQADALYTLGIKNYSILGFRDGKVQANSDTIGCISNLINEFKPDVVLTHYPNDTHQDHVAVSRIVDAAARGKNCCMAYFASYTSIGFEANLYVDISGHILDKKRAILSFKSQIDKYSGKGQDFLKKALLLNELYGYEDGCEYAEGFSATHISI